MVLWHNYQQQKIYSILREKVCKSKGFNVHMSDDKIKEIWGEMYDLIPKIREVVRKALRKDSEYIVHGKTIQKMERDVLRSRLDMLRRKWIIDILYYARLKEKPYFSDFQKNLDDINSRTLTNRLQEMEELGMITRNVQTGKPIRVYYELTDFGLGIYELLMPLNMFIADNFEGPIIKDEN